MSIKMSKLMELEEKRGQAMQTLETHQQQVKRRFDKKDRVRIVREGDLDLKWDAYREKLGRHSKFDALWSGPYLIDNCKEANAFQLRKLGGEYLG